MKPASPPKKKAAPKVSVTEDDEGPRRRAARTVSKTYVEIDSDEGDGGDDSMFVDDDD